MDLRRFLVCRPRPCEAGSEEVASEQHRSCGMGDDGERGDAGSDRGAWFGAVSRGMEDGAGSEGGGPEPHRRHAEEAPSAWVSFIIGEGALWRQLVSRIFFIVIISQSKSVEKSQRRLLFGIIWYFQ